jgi:hypothetical protein
MDYYYSTALLLLYQFFEVVHNLTEMVSIVVHNLEKRPNPADFTKIVVHNLEELVKK